MENYKINKNLGLVRLPFKLTADFDDSTEEFYKANMVDFALSKEIDIINDYEITPFRPLFSTLTMDVYFYRHIDTILDSSIRTMLSAAYVDYYDKMKDYFANIKSTSHLEFNEALGIPDNITAYPTFWNSFGYPFYTKKESWYKPLADGTPSTVLLPSRFDPQTYLYNSFIKMNFYTTPYSTTQELLFQNVIYVNPRWCSLEGDAGGSWHRPTFSMDETTDGYYLYWLNQYNIDTFYVSFQFWDALNGRMINLLPSNTLETGKHWVQSVNQGFDSRSLYFKYKINYNNKRYTINSFDYATTDWKLKVGAIRLYELIFMDTNYDYFVKLNPNISVPNGVVTTTTVTPTITTVPKFNIDISTARMVNGTHVSNITPATSVFTVVHNSKTTFQTIRESWHQTIADVGETYQDTVTITNNSSVPIYLKNAEITLPKQFTMSKNRINGMYKSEVNQLGTLYTTYTFLSVPDAKRSQDHGLQTNFNRYYNPAYNNKSTAGTHYHNTVAVDGLDDGHPNWWDSVAWMSWFFPINESNFTQWGRQFSEQLYITHEGDDLRDIQPNETMNLSLSYGFGNNYGYVNIEPLLYELCIPNIIYDKYYELDLEYTVVLYFNDLRSSLPETANTKTFKVKSYFKFEYVTETTPNGGRITP